MKTEEGNQLKGAIMISSQTDRSGNLSEASSSSRTTSKWADIIPLDSKRFSAFQCFEKEITIGRNNGNSLLIEDKRLSGNHCKLIFDEKENQVSILDLSTNGTFVFDVRVGKGSSKPLESGDLVYVLHKSKVGQAEALGFIVKFTFSLNKTPTTFSSQIDLQKQQQEQELLLTKQKQEEESRFEKIKIQFEEEKRKIQEELNKFISHDEKISEELECVICMETIYQCVTLQPCLHNLCGACFYDWKQKSTECPNCRTQFNEFSKNPTLNNVVQAFLEKHPNKRNTPDYYTDQDVKNRLLWNTNSISSSSSQLKSEGISAPSTIPQINRQTSATQPSNNYPQSNQNHQGICAECTTTRAEDGYKCDDSTQHVKCFTCFKSLPNRGEDCENQKCVLCNGFFCNLYFRDAACIKKSQISSGTYLEHVKNILPPTFIPLGFFNGNNVESKVLSQYMSINRISTKSVFQEMITYEMKPGKFYFEISPKWNASEKENKRILIKDTSAVCGSCFTTKLWFQILVKYRMKIAKHLPPPYNKRSKCWYGLNCRTQTEELHAKYYDHICESERN